MLPISASIEFMLALFLLTIPAVLLLVYVFGRVLLRLFPRSFLLTIPAFGITGLVAWLLMFGGELTTGSTLACWTVFVVSVAIGATAEIARPGTARGDNQVRTTACAGQVFSKKPLNPRFCTPAANKSCIAGCIRTAEHQNEALRALEENS